MNDRAFDLLSERQLQCLRLVARDRSAKQIGIDLGLSHHTVENHIKAALARLGVSSRFDAARLLREWEGTSLRSASPVSGMAPDSLPPIKDPPTGPAGFGRTGSSFREERAVFGLSAEFPPAAIPPELAGARLSGLSKTRRLLLIAIATAVVPIGSFAAIAVVYTIERLLKAVDLNIW